MFEVLRMDKPLIVVVNEDLMDNHQSELAEELAERKHLLCAGPQTLHQVIKSMDLDSLIPYPPADATPVARRELAEELAERKHLLCAGPQTLHQVIKSMDLDSLIPYPPADATPVVRH